MCSIRTPELTTSADLHIYMAGVGMQQLFILLFLLYAMAFHRQITREQTLDTATRSKALTMLYSLYVCLALITVRCFAVSSARLNANNDIRKMRIIFRICEYSKGLQSTLPNHEAYQYCLDSLPMLGALVVLNIIHPGRLMPGSNGNIPSRKARKNGIRTKLDLSSGSEMAETELNPHFGGMTAA